MKPTNYIVPNFTRKLAKFIVPNLILILTATLVLAATQQINVTTGDNTVKINASGTTAIFNCNITSTNTMTSTYPDCPECSSCEGNITTNCMTALQNLSNIASQILDKSRTESYYQPYISCYANLTQCNVERKACDLSTEWKNKYDVELPACQRERDSRNTDLSNCISEKNVCLNTELPKCKEDLEKKNKDWLIFLIAGAVVGAGLMFMYLRKIKLPSHPMDKDFPTRQ